MKKFKEYFFSVLNWLLGIIFLYISVSLLAAGRVVPSIPLFIIVLLLLPPVRDFIYKKTKIRIHPALRFFICLILLIVYVKLLYSDIAKMQIIYRSYALQQEFLELYDKKMQQWPVAYEDKFIDTEYGQTHVIISGNEEAPPLVLLHASAVASWSWYKNIDSLAAHFHIYAIDNIGEAGKSKLYDLQTFPKTGGELSDYYFEVFDQLGLDTVFVAGASNGGFITLTLLSAHPERIKKAVLIGPMGLTPATAGVGLKIMGFTFFPIEPFKSIMFDWAMGRDPETINIMREWFEKVLSGIPVARVMRPVAFKPEELQKIDVPVLLFLGEKDEVVGNPVAALGLAENLPDLKVKVLDTYHIIALEQPDTVDKYMNNFLIGELGADTLESITEESGK